MGYNYILLFFLFCIRIINQKGGIYILFVRNNPYDHKKCSFSKTLKSAITIVLIVGLTITISQRIKSQYLVKKASETYVETISNYQTMISITAQFFKQVRVQTPEECFYLYTKLLWEGYFSNSRNYVYNETDQNNVIGNYGARIATGNGDCKNNEDFFCKLLNELGFEAHQIVGLFSNYEEDDFLLKDRLFGNHVITVVKYNGADYYFDTTNCCIYEKSNFGHIHDDKQGFCVKLNLISSYMLGYNDMKETVGIIHDYVSGEPSLEFNTIEVDSSKVLVLRKSLEPILQQMAQTIEEEG